MVCGMLAQVDLQCGPLGQSRKVSRVGFGLWAPFDLAAVMSCDSDCVFQVLVGRSHWNCYISLNVLICTKHCAFPGKRRFSCGEKLARLRDGCGRRHFAVESVSICARCN